MVKKNNSVITRYYWFWNFEQLVSLGVGHPHHRSTLCHCLSTSLPLNKLSISATLSSTPVVSYPQIKSRMQFFSPLSAEHPLMCATDTRFVQLVGLLDDGRRTGFYFSLTLLYLYARHSFCIINTVFRNVVRMPTDLISLGCNFQFMNFISKYIVTFFNHTILYRWIKRQNFVIGPQ